jgi:hypothetical protein
MLIHNRWTLANNHFSLVFHNDGKNKEYCLYRQGANAAPVKTFLLTGKPGQRYDIINHLVSRGYRES